MLTSTLFGQMFVFVHTIVCSVVSSLWFGKVSIKKRRVFPSLQTKRDLLANGEGNFNIALTNDLPDRQYTVYTDQNKHSHHSKQDNYIWYICQVNNKYCKE